MIRRCGRNCKHEYQDKKYGLGNRVHTEPTKAGVEPRCTVCGPPDWIGRIRTKVLSAWEGLPEGMKRQLSGKP